MCLDMRAACASQFSKALVEAIQMRIDMSISMSVHMSKVYANVYAHVYTNIHTHVCIERPLNFDQTRDCTTVSTVVKQRCQAPGMCRLTSHPSTPGTRAAVCSQSILLPYCATFTSQPATHTVAAAAQCSGRAVGRGVVFTSDLIIVVLVVV